MTALIDLLNQEDGAVLVLSCIPPESQVGVTIMDIAEELVATPEWVNTYMRELRQAAKFRISKRYVSHYPCNAYSLTLPPDVRQVLEKRLDEIERKWPA